MSPQAEEFTIGVEEEYQIINPRRVSLVHVCSRFPIAQKALGEEVQPEARFPR